MRKKEWQKAIILSERLRLEQVADVDRCVEKVGGKQGWGMVREYRWDREFIKKLTTIIGAEIALHQ